MTLYFTNFFLILLLFISLYENEKKIKSEIVVVKLRILFLIH